jgi:hypothetical protein
MRRDGILTAIHKAKGAHAPALDKLKTSLTVRAQDLVADTQWLPALLRRSRLFTANRSIKRTHSMGTVLSDALSFAKRVAHVQLRCHQTGRVRIR